MRSLMLIIDLDDRAGPVNTDALTDGLGEWMRELEAEEDGFAKLGILDWRFGVGDPLGLLSLARTALDDPDGIDEKDEEFEDALHTSETLDRVYAEAAPSPYLLYAINRIDEAMGLLGARTVAS